jgi:hypothetical protein
MDEPKIIALLDLDSVSSGGFSSNCSRPAQQGAAAAEASTYFRSILPLVLSRTGAAS